MIAHHEQVPGLAVGEGPLERAFERAGDIDVHSPSHALEEDLEGFGLELGLARIVAEHSGLDQDQQSLSVFLVGQRQIVPGEHLDLAWVDPDIVQLALERLQAERVDLAEREVEALGVAGVEVGWDEYADHPRNHAIEHLDRGRPAFLGVMYQLIEELCAEGNVPLFVPRGLRQSVGEPREDVPLLQVAMDEVLARDREDRFDDHVTKCYRLG